MTYSITEQIECVERELWFRRQVYPRRVGEGRMTQQLADRQIAVMESVLATLKGIGREQAELPL